MFTTIRYGLFFRKLTIHARRRRNCTKFIAHQVVEFLQEMKSKGVQLETFEMQRMKILTDGFHEAQHIERLTEFLTTQSGLTTADFTNGSNPVNIGIRILLSLPAEKVQHLKLLNFFSERFTIAGPYLDTITRFSNLKSLSLNSFTLSDEVLERLTAGLNGQLETFSVSYDVVGDARPDISDHSWVLLKQSCPRMGVVFDIVLTDITAFRRIAKRSIPLKQVIVKLTSPWNNTSAVILFNHLTANFSETLRKAEFELCGSKESGIADGLSEVVLTCVNLTHLTFRSKFPDLEIQDVLNAVYNAVVLAGENRPVSLTKFRLPVRWLKDRKKRQVIQSKRIFNDRFRSIGVDFKIKFKR